MKRIILQFVSIAIIASLGASFVPLVTPRVSASSSNITSKCLNGAFSSVMSDLLSNFTPSVTKVGTEDTASRAQTKMFQFDTCVQEGLKKAEELALQKVKEDLLDDLVDQTVKWIRDDKQPKYVSNYKDMIGDIDKEAISNVMREIDFSTYPDKKVLDGVKAGLKRQAQQNASEIPAGSLSKKLSALPTQEEMEKASDISNAGFAGYIDIVTERNPNLITNAVEATLEQQKKEITEEKKFYQGEGGANPVFDCEEWVAVKNDPNYPDGNGPYAKDASGRVKVKFTDPQKDAPAGSAGEKYICQNSGIGSAGRDGKVLNTPSNIVNKTTESILVEQTVPSIVSSKDLDGYISKITDAAIFRLFEEGINMFNKGVKRGEWSGAAEFVSEQTNEALGNFLGYRDETVVTKEMNATTQGDLKTRVTAVIDNATGTAREARVTVQNRINYLGRLLDDGISTNIINCYYDAMRNNEPWKVMQMNAIGHPFPHEVNMGAIRGENQNYISALNAVWQTAKSLLSQVLAINENTSGETINQVKSATASAEADLKTGQDNLSGFKDRLAGVITITEKHRAVCAPGGLPVN